MCPTPAIIPKLHAYEFVCLCVCVCLQQRHIYPHSFQPTSLHHGSCLYVSVILGWPGDFVNSSYESVMTSRHAYSCGVNKWSSALTTEAKKDIVQTAIVGLLHILIIAISDLLQDMCLSSVWTKKKYFVSDIMLRLLPEIHFFSDLPCQTFSPLSDYSQIVCI